MTGPVTVHTQQTLGYAAALADCVRQGHSSIAVIVLKDRGLSLNELLTLGVPETDLDMLRFAFEEWER